MSTIRFADFEINKSSRELRLRNRELALQPRVFDLLCYLIKHRDRVVSKDELLEALWPGVIVTDGSLQRAISLARSALRQGGLTDAIRTHARSGYRFNIEISQLDNSNDGTDIPDDLIEARRFYENSDWDNAIRSFEISDSKQALEGADLERWADAIQCTGQSFDAIAPLERAVAAHNSQGDIYGAARAMLNLAHIQFEQREFTIAKAWHQRAARLLPETEISRELGTLKWLGARFATLTGELEQSKELAEQAYHIGQDLSDPDIEVLGLDYMGVALQAMGHMEEGAQLQDEAAAAVLAGNVSPIVGGLVYCGVIWSCRNRGDWERAAQWTDHFNRWCKTSPLHNLPGTCRLHRAEVLTIRGELDEAESEAKAMAESLASRAPWAEGDAYQVLGNIYLFRGNLDQAEAAFRRAHELGWDPQPGYALLQVARGATEAALQTLESSIADNNWANQQKRGLLLANFVIVAVAAGNVDRASNALTEIDQRPELFPTDALTAALCRAKADFARFENRLDEAVALYRQAIQLWQKVGSPLNIAVNRLYLANSLIQQNNVHNAELELGSAISSFEKIGAAALLKNCVELKRQILGST